MILNWSSHIENDSSDSIRLASGSIYWLFREYIIVSVAKVCLIKCNSKSSFGELNDECNTWKKVSYVIFTRYTKWSVYTGYMHAGMQ